MISRYRLKTKALNYIHSGFGNLNYLVNKDSKLFSHRSNYSESWCYSSSNSSKSKFSSIHMRR